MNAHTPGPWKVLNLHGVFVLAHDAMTVAQVTYMLPDAAGETTRLANARLIAAAPAMAEALRAMLERAPAITMAEVEMARAALAEAGL